MKVFITGGAGFIGTNFIYYWQKKYPQDQIVCVDALTYAGRIENLEDARKSDRFTFYKENICDKEAMERIFEKERPEYVVHFAAESHVDNSIKHPEIFLETNVLGTQVLLEACRKYPVKRFHQISTDEVYGDLPLERKDLFFTEDTPLNPSSPYSASKASADFLVMAYRRTYGLPVSISRCSNNYGPYQHTEKMIPLMITNAKADKALPVYGTGDNVRDWLYVEDHCRAIDLILHGDCEGEIFNIGGHNEISNLELVKYICKQLGKSEDLITFVEDRKGHDKRYAIDPSKIQRILGWEPETDVSAGLMKTIAWYTRGHK
ncbi:MAG: dTDP-glucose 4,6-dehydratase [Lachnospiraceae bacterium]|nr:dTDP-glucose 4,6-dehydratase [Lachnospiraceae bacterium]